MNGKLIPKHRWKSKFRKAAQDISENIKQTSLDIV